MSICPHILKQPCNSAQALVEMVSFFQRMRNGLRHRFQKRPPRHTRSATCLENLFILFRVCLLHLFRGSDVLFEVSTGMFPGLETLHQQPSGLKLSVSYDNHHFYSVIRTSVGLASGTASSDNDPAVPPVVLAGRVCEPGCPAFSGGYADMMGEGYKQLVFSIGDNCLRE